MNRHVRLVALQAARVGVLMAVVFSAPAVCYFVVREAAVGRYATAALAYAAHTALLYPAGMFVGHLKQDGTYEFGVGGSYTWFAAGGVYLLISMAIGPFGAREVVLGTGMVLAGVIVFVTGVAGVKRTRELQSRRRAAGQCVGCGYDLAGLGGAERCPECGVPLRARKRQAAA